MNYIDIYEKVKERYAEKPAIVDKNAERGISYGALDAISNLVAGKLKAQGMRSGDYVIIDLARGMEYPAAYLGALKLGLCVVPAGPDFSDERFEEIKNDCNAKLVISDDFFDDIITFAPIKEVQTGPQHSLLIYNADKSLGEKPLSYSFEDLVKAVVDTLARFKGIRPLRYALTEPLVKMPYIIEYLSIFLQGGVLHIVNEETSASEEKLIKYLKKNHITITDRWNDLLKTKSAQEVNKFSDKATHLDEIPHSSPLAPAQVGVYMECVEDPETTKYNIPSLIELPKEIDKERYIAAVKEVVSKHPAFSVHFGLNEGVPCMLYDKMNHEVARLEYDSIEAARLDFVKPFDLENGPICRFALINVKGTSYFLSDIHHLIYDGSSCAPLFKQIDDVYQGRECPEEELTIFDIAAFSEEPKSEKLKKEFSEFFADRFEGVDADSKPLFDQNDKGEEGIGFFTEDFNLPGITDFAKANGVNSNAVFLSAFGYALAKFNGQKQSLFTTCHTGRRDKRLKNSIGMFVRTLPIACKFEEDMSVAQLLQNTYNDYYKTSQNDCIPFGKLAAKYGLGLDVSFIYQSTLLASPSIDGKETPFILLDENIAVSDLEYMLMEEGEDNYHITVHYSKSMYTEGLMKSFTSMYKEVLKNMLSAESLKDIRFCNEEVIETLNNFNKTEKAYDETKTVVELFREQALKTPDAECVVFENNRYSYSQIDDITDRLAGYLVKKGVGINKVVGVLIPRSEYMAICSLAVLKAGAAYLPLDPSYPEERLNLMVKDASAMMLLTTAELSPIISDEFTGERMMISEIPKLGALDVKLPKPSIDDLFVLLYTSGSTGTPKGVMFCHSNTMVTSAWQRDFYELGVGSNVTAYASYGFDANVFDTYATITSGACLHIISDDIRLDFNALIEYFNENKITHSTMTTQVGRQFAEMGGSKYLKHLSVAGEKLTPLQPPKSFKLYNLYGPTEGSVLASGFLVDKFYKDIPIGKPTDNTKLYVVDEFDRLLPPGATGELWISGKHVTKGYLNRPEKTAEAYGANPFICDVGYEKIYKTGDVVRLLPDGNYQFVGRADGQVKVRGFRVELTEVEEVIRRFDQVKDVTLAAFDDNAGGKFITAYVVSDEKVDIKALNAFIKSEKPPYMVPAVTMQIDAIPFTKNQKVDKKALPKPERKVEDVVLPQGEMQTRLFEIVKAVVGHEQFGVNTDLLDAGLTSIASLRLNVILSKEYGVNVKLEDIRENNTIEKLETFLQGAKKVNKYAKMNDYPITETQKGIFIEWSLDKKALTYNMPLLLKLDESVDMNQLQEAIKKAVDAHPYLKATLFADENGDIRAKRNDEEDAKVSYAISEKLPDNLLMPFDLLEHRLYRIALLHTLEGKYLFMDFHHIVSDGTSQAILLEDINMAYAGDTLETESYTGFEIALDEEASRASSALDKAKEYYDSIFTGCETDCLPPKAPEKFADSEAAKGYIKKSKANVEALDAFLEKNGLTENAYFNAAFGYALSRFITKDSPVYTSIYNGRSSSLLAGAVSMLVKTLPVMVNSEEDAAVIEYIKNTQTQLMNSMANDIYSFAEISASYGIHSDILFVYQGDNFAFDQMCGKPAEVVDLGFEVAKAPISIQVIKTASSYEYDCDYMPAKFNHSLIEELIDAFDMAVIEFSEKDRLKDVSLLSYDAKAKLADFNDTKAEYRQEPVHHIFEKEAKAHPERMAVSAEGKELSYDRLNRLANRVAHSLIAEGVKANDIIAFMVDRTVEIDIAQLGILKAGGAFLGILPSYPDDRIDFCLRDADSPIIITTESIKRTRPALFSDDKPYRVLTVEALIQNENEENPNANVGIDDLSYAIYTSGSTGRPKGVMITHKNLACCAQPLNTDYKWYCGNMSARTCLAVSSLSFDMSIMDNLVMLITGHSVVIATDKEIHNPMMLRDLMLKYEVGSMLATPSLLIGTLLLDEFKPVVKNLRCIVSGAEAFPSVLYDGLKKINPQIRILNGYGPTECTITCCAKDLYSTEGVTIGAPSANAAFYVMDKFGNILPPYACGELIITGDFVGNGYINLPEKNAEAFFELNGEKAYHSGDIVRYTSDGEIEFFGRKDNQVKLRGFRVELDEIEKCMAAFDGVKLTKVIVRNNGSEDFLAGFFTAGCEVDLDKLKAHMKSKLTHYMVPDVLMQLDEMPLTPNGKIDKKALPEVKREVKKSGKKAAKKSLEGELCDMFASVLGLDEIFVDDNFFENGGTSLSASKVVMQLMSKGIDIEYQYIFDYPTPQSLAEYIESLNGDKTLGPDQNQDEAKLEVLKNNTLEHAKEASRKPLGTVLLTGATGFLGVHILKELLDLEEGKIVCLVRGSEDETAEERLTKLYEYYFTGQKAGKGAKGALGSGSAAKSSKAGLLAGGRIQVIDADITDENLDEILSNVKFDTLINSAACVKHYAADDILERINVKGVKNLIALAKKRDAKMIQISTTSVPGVHTDETLARNLIMHEDELFVIDDMDNKYVISKYRAELAMFDAISDGMRGKVIRVGNLMGRYSDGKFQINLNTNAFLHALRGFATIGKCPISHSTDPMSFSPIDLTAKVIVLLAGTPDQFTAFHADNRQGFDEMKLIQACNESGIKITPVDDEEYYSDYYRMLGDEKINSRLSGLVTNDRPDLHMVETSNIFTANVLYRLGFAWPFMDIAYLRRAIDSLKSEHYFD